MHILGSEAKPVRWAYHPPVSVTIDDTSRITGLGRTKIYELISEGRLKTVAIGRRRLVLYNSIETLLGIAA